MRLDLDLVLVATGLSLALRLAIVVATLPLLDLRQLPALWRLALAVVLAAALAPAIAPLVPPGAPLLDWRWLVAEALRSLVIGALLAFAVNVVFAAARFAGAVIGMQVGFAIVNTFDPQSGAQVSVISQVYYLVAVLLFFAVDAHHVVLAGLVRSCEVLPPFAPVDGAAASWLMLREYGEIFVLGLRMAAPVVVVLLMISAAMGVVVKTAPQIHILVVGFPVKIAVGLLTIGASLVFYKELVTGTLTGMADLLDRVLLALV